LGRILRLGEATLGGASPTSGQIIAGDQQAIRLYEQKRERIEGKEKLYRRADWGGATYKFAHRKALEEKKRGRTRPAGRATEAAQQKGRPPKKVGSSL